MIQLNMLKLIAFIAAVIIFNYLPSFAQGTSINTTKKVTVMADETSFEAIKAAAIESGKAVITGSVYKIPLSALTAAATHIALLKIGEKILCNNICDKFQEWALSKQSGKDRPPFSSEDKAAFDLDVDITSSSGTITVTIPYFAKATSSKGGKFSGYVAPMGPKGATMELTICGVTFTRLECPCH
jgi:hypothetical protein